LCGADFKIEKGEFVAIMGPSGSGKSTLMQILGFLDKPTDGEYFFQGTRVDEFSEDQLSEIRNQEVGFVFQAFNLLPRTTVYENVELPLLYSAGFNNKKENEKKVRKALEAVSLSHRLDYFSNQISGGQKQRVAIARALVNNPKVIFADEPTGNLDSKSGKMIMEIFQKLNKKGKTIILVTHENEIAEYARRIIRVEDGRIAKD
jgi:putative ABC transport system ATP-binding protein